MRKYFFSDLVVVWDKELHGCPSLPHISILEESATFFYFFLQDRASYSGRSSTESAGGLGRQVLDKLIMLTWERKVSDADDGVNCD